MPRQLALPIARLAIAVIAAGCSNAPGGAAPPRYQLACDGANTPQQATLFCIRLDTRNGEALVIDLDKLPVTTGSSRALDEADATYRIECASTATAQRSDFRCLRLHTRTGEVVMLRLSELPHWPH
jgi:urease accessory protein UreE